LPLPPLHLLLGTHYGALLLLPPLLLWLGAHTPALSWVTKVRRRSKDDAPGFVATSTGHKRAKRAAPVPGGDARIFTKRSKNIGRSSPKRHTDTLLGGRAKTDSRRPVGLNK
jgi:hypothetical protein